MSAQSENNAIRRFLRGASSIQLSSSKLSWSCLVLEKHIAPVGDRPETTIDCFLLCLWQGHIAARGDHANSRRSFVPRIIQPGTMTSSSPGAVAAVRPHNPSNFLLCAIDRRFLHDIGDEMREESGTNAYPADTISLGSTRLRRSLPPPDSSPAARGSGIRRSIRLALRRRPRASACSTFPHPYPSTRQAATALCHASLCSPAPLDRTYRGRFSRSIRS